MGELKLSYNIKLVVESIGNFMSKTLTVWLLYSNINDRCMFYYSVSVKRLWIITTVSSKYQQCDDTPGSNYRQYYHNDTTPLIIIFGYSDMPTC